MSGPSTYEPKTGIEKWLDTRLPIIRFNADLMEFPTPKNLNYWWTFGGILAVCLVVQIVTGIVLGPGLLGAAFPQFYGFVFTPQVVGALNGVAWWAVMLFVWIAGIELDLREAWQRRRETGLAAGLAMAGPVALGCGAGVLLLVWGGWIGARAQPWQFVLGVGMACAVTALPILVLFLTQLDLLRAPLGQRVLRYASLDDVAIWAVLALILLDWDRLVRQAGFILIFLTLAPLMRRWIPRLQMRDRWPVALVWLLAAALTSDWAGLHYMVGAFLAGAVLDSQWFNQQKMDLLRDHVLLVLMPVFFLSTGLRTSWDLGGAAVFVAAAALLAAAVAGKFGGIWLAGRALGWSRDDIALAGWLLQTKGLIEIIFASILLDKGVITSAMFTALLLMAVASTMLTVPMVAPRLARS